jgi:hypothetical protein
VIAAADVTITPMASRRPIRSVEGFIERIFGSMPIAEHAHFVYATSMDVEHPDTAVSRIAAAIGEPARARMLYCLVDGRARTSTELSVVANVNPSTGSVHLQRLKTQRLVKVFALSKILPLCSCG